MSGHAPILACKLCASALARRQQAALTRNLQRCLSTSPVIARLAPKPSSSSSIAGRRSRPLRHGTPPPYASPSRRFPSKTPASSVFKLSSDLRVQAGEGARDHDVLRQLQARTAELSVADPASQMLQILSALARRLGLDGAELKKLAKDWADTSPFESQKLLDPKGKGKQDARQSVDIEAVQKDLRVHGPRAIERAVLSCLVSWIREAASEGRYVLSSQLDAILETLDVRFPPEQFPRARSKARKLILHVGPTNSGKTYNALCALAKAPRGVFAGPLRLLATEVYNRFNAGLIGGLTPANPRVCNLITGEERRIKDKFGGLDSCTIETMDLINSYDVVVIDEIQMIADPNRGSAWTNALLGAQAKEVHLCGEASVVDLVKRIGKACGDEVIVNRYERLSPLQIAKSSLAGDLRKLRPGDCVVTFSRNNIFALKTEIEKTTGLKVAVAYGSLPPEVREEQAKGFNAAGTQGGYDVMVASDAIGMGLNLKIKRVIFETLSKYDGQQAVDLSHSQIKQIAGRAGRYGTNTTTSSPSAPDTDNIDPVKEKENHESAGGIVTCLDPEDMPLLRKALAAPMEPIEKATLRARPSELEAFSSLLPETTTQSHVFEIFPVLASMGPDYYSPAFGAGLKVSNLVSDIPNLLLADRWEMVQAPVNLRDPKVAALYTKWVGAYANQQIVRLTDWFSEDGAEYSQMLAEFRKVDDRNTDVKLAAGLNNELATKFASPANLAGLESLHRCIGLYHWLSSRFSLLFPQAAEARLLKIETEDAIDFILRQMTFVRKRYLSSSRKNAPFFQHSGRLDERAML